ELATNARLSPALAASGTLDEWRAATAAAVKAKNCPHWTIGIIAGFVGVLVGLTGLDTCGINLSGRSSTGKTTAQRLAVSPWSSVDIRKAGLFQSMRTTENAAEAMAQRASGTVLALDEMAHVSGQVAARMIYSLAGGVGKRRLDADAAMREGYSWATFAILSGECSLAEKINGDGGAWTAGMAGRLTAYDVAGGNP